MDRLAPEERLLLALSRLEPSEAGHREARAAVGAPAFRWERALELACYHRVHALLARNLDDAALRDLVPADVRGNLLQLRMASELRNERYVHATAEPFARLAAEKIPVLLLKGAALASTVFPAGSRPLNDIDLLIRPEDYPCVVRVLEKAQFRRVFKEGWTEQKTLRDYHEVTLVKKMKNETLVVDLHWRLLAPDRFSALGYDLPAAGFLARAVPAAFGPARVLAPSAEDIFVHLATQIGIDGLQAHLGRLADLCALVEKGMDWRRLVETATRARAAGITHLALSLTVMLGGSVPEAALRRLRGACPTCGIATRALAVPSFPFEALRTASRVVLIPLLFGRPWQRLLYGLSLALPTARTERLHILPVPHSARACLRRWRAILLAAACGVVLVVERAFPRLAARMLWHAPAPASEAREPAERRHLVPVP